MTDDVGWRQRGACKHYDGTLWFPEETGAGNKAVREQAKAICRTCPVQRTCLEWSLERDERFGIWGGCTVQERDSIFAARQK